MIFRAQIKTFLSHLQKRSHVPALKNAAWLLSEKTLLHGAGFIFVIVLTHYWSVAELGDYQYILAFLALLSPFSSLGLNSLVSREIVERREDIDSIVGTAIALRFMGACIGGGIFFLLSFWFIDAELKVLFFILLGVQLTHALSVIDFCFEAKVQSKISALLRAGVGIGFMLIKLVAVVQGADFSFILLITALEWTVLALAWLYVYSVYHGTLRKLTWCSLQARRYLKRCGWLMLSSIAAIIYLKIDQVMLGVMASREAVAFYSVASRLSEVWYLVPGILVASFYPALLKAKKENLVYDVKLQQLASVLCWGAVLIAISMTLVAPWLVPILFGQAYSPVTGILMIHIWASVFVFMRALFSKWLLIEDIPKYSLMTHGAGAIINLVLNAIMIPMWGAEGAAWATLISYATASYLGLFLFRETRTMGKVMTKAILTPILFFRSA